jgi:hypothetical protein
MLTSLIQGYKVNWHCNGEQFNQKVKYSQLSQDVAFAIKIHKKKRKYTYFRPITPIGKGLLIVRVLDTIYHLVGPINMRVK